jgi:hypothetical protein
MTAIEAPLITSVPDLLAVAGTLDAAFVRDPVVSWMFPPGTPDRARAEFFLLTTEYLLDHDGVVAATPGYGAVLVWTQPNAMVPTEASTRAFYDELDRLCGSRARTVMELLDEHYPADLPPHCHVMFAAARPEVQARGARSMLTTALEREVRRDGAGVYAEASSRRSLVLWERLGLSRLGDEVRVPDGPSLYPVWAPPPFF